MNQPDSLHGKVGLNLGSFSRLLPPDPNQPSIQDLDNLAVLMQDRPDPADDHPDPEENLMIPAGYTYFGQFIDHDLTFDTTSSLNLADPTPFSDMRTPRFDLDNLYGTGPDAMPYMYQDGVSLIEDSTDLPRSTVSKRAIIGDPRDDENSIVCNLQMAFIRFHNKVVQRLQSQDKSLAGPALFKRAQQEVRWTYQRIIAEDFLPRIINKRTLESFNAARMPNAQGLTTDESAYALYPAEKRSAIPIEFSSAAYRFGHSMVRSGYRLSKKMPKPLQIFLPPPKGSAGPGSLSPAQSLVGFSPLPAAHLIDDWGRFFPNPLTAGLVKKPGRHNATNLKKGITRLQYAYRIDTALENPLAHLPQSVAGSGETEFRLAARNLIRASHFEVASGQAFAKKLGVVALTAESLVTRTKAGRDPNPIIENFVRISDQFIKKTPLWFYILAEAQAPIVKWAKGKSFTEQKLLADAGKTTTQLGPVGGRIVLEVFSGLLDADAASYRSDPGASADNWKPLIKSFTMWDLVKCNFVTVPAKRTKKA